jgi:hypothetical protein
MNHISFKKPAIQGYGSRLRSFRTPNGAFPIRGRLSLSVLLIFVSIIFSSCNFNKPEDFSLVGTWLSPYGDGYVITENSITYDDGEYYESKWGPGGIFGWTGKILETTGSSSGYIYVQYESLEEGNPSNYVGKFIAIHYENLSEVAVQLANPYKEDETSFAETTLEQAKIKFTVENGYFGEHGEYVKK